MKRVLSWLLAIGLLGISLLPSFQAEPLRADSTGYWQLDYTDYSLKESTEQDTYSMSNGNAQVRTAAEQDVFAASMTWSAPAERYEAGDVVQLTLAIQVDEYVWAGDPSDPDYDQAYAVLNHMGASVAARIDQEGIGWSGITGSAVRLLDTDGENYLKVTADMGQVGVASASAQVSGVFPTGWNDGDMRTVYVTCNAGAIRYNYRWYVPDAPPTALPTPEEATAQPTSTSWSIPTSEPPPCLGAGIVRFGDLRGEVNVRPNSEDDDAYCFAELSTPLCDDDRIRTLMRSGAILSWSDMSTFIMKEDTTIVLDLQLEREGLIGLVAGNIWVNLQRMAKGQGLEVELSQAVAGIKGTTLICEEDGTTSTIKVIEGDVLVTPNVGKPLTISDGEMVVVSSSGAGPIQQFSVEDEMATWDETAQQITADAIAEHESGFPIVAIVVIVVLLFGAVGVFAYVFIKRNKN